MAVPIRACGSAQLRLVAYGAGIAAGTEYLAVAIENAGTRLCRVGTTVTLMAFDGHRFRRLPAEATTPTFGAPLALVRPGQRAVVQIMATWAAEERNNADCPDAKPHPLDRVTAIKLDTGTTATISNPFDIERCLRRVATLTDDRWLTQCQRESRPVCQPIPVATHRPQIG